MNNAISRSKRYSRCRPRLSTTSQPPLSTQRFSKHHLSLTCPASSDCIFTASSADFSTFRCFFFRSRPRFFFLRFQHFEAFGAYRSLHLNRFSYPSRKRGITAPWPPSNLWWSGDRKQKFHGFPLISLHLNTKRVISALGHRCIERFRY